MMNNTALQILFHRQQKTFEIGECTVARRVWGISPHLLRKLEVRIRCFELTPEALFWTKSSHYCDENIFAALVHTALDSLGRRLSPGISLVPRASNSYVLAYHTSIITVQICTKDEDICMFCVHLLAGVSLMKLT